MNDRRSLILSKMPLFSEKFKAVNPKSTSYRVSSAGESAVEGLWVSVLLCVDDAAYATRRHAIMSSNERADSSAASD